jgi:hypothetical protein
MTDWPATRAQQIAALEAALQVPGLPEGTKQQILEQLRALQSLDSIQGTATVSGELQGNAIGVNLGTVQTFFGGAQPPTSPAGQPARTATPEQIADQRELLAAHRRTLAVYLRQLATLGSAYVPPSVSSGIREARVGVRQAKSALRGWGVEVEDLPGEEESA